MAKIKATLKNSAVSRIAHYKDEEEMRRGETPSSSEEKQTQTQKKTIVNATLKKSAIDNVAYADEYKRTTSTKTENHNADLEGRSRYADPSKEGVMAIKNAVDKSDDVADKRTMDQLYHYYVMDGMSELEDPAAEAERLRKKYNVEMPADTRVVPDMPETTFKAPDIASSFTAENVDLQIAAAERQLEEKLIELGKNPEYQEARLQLYNNRYSPDAFKYKEVTDAYEAEVEYLKSYIDTMKYFNNFSEKEYKDTFGGQFSANYRLGNISYRANDAYSEYISNPTQANKAKAENLAAMEEYFQGHAAEALDDQNVKASWLTKDAAGYVPQMLEQTAAKLSGGIPAALVAGVATGGAGAFAGYKYGASAGAAKESFSQMQGAAYRALIAEGVDEETAIAAATDEAFISSVIEFADTFGELSFAGIGKAAKAVFKTGAKQTLNKAAKKAVGKTVAQQVLSGGVKYGLNAGQEMLEEGSQQTVSIANIERAKRGETGIGSLVSETFKTLGKVLAGEDPDSAGEIFDAAAAGGKIALMFGGGRIATNTAITAALNNKAAKDTGKANREKMDTIVEDGLKQDKSTTAYKQAAAVKQKIDNGVEVGDAELGRLVYALDLAGTETYMNAIRDDKETLNALIEEGKASGKNTVSAKIATQIENKIKHGKEVTTEDVQRLVAVNSVYIEAENAQTEADAHLEQVRSFTGYGDKGVETFTEILEERGDVAPRDLKLDFDVPYQAGLVNMNREMVKLDNDVALAAYNAGQRDYIAAQAKDKSKTFSVHSEAGFDSKNAPNDVTREESDLIDMLSKAYGVRTSWADGLKGNAEIRGNEVMLARDFEREIPIEWDANGNVTKTKKVSAVYHALHEIGMHRLMQVAPEEGRAFLNAMYQDRNMWMKGAPTLAEHKRSQYAEQNVSLSTEKAIEEWAANELLPLFENEADLKATLDRIMNGTDEKAKQGARKLGEILRDLWEKVKAFFNRTKPGTQERAAAQTAMNEVAELRAKYEKAMEAAVANVRKQGDNQTVKAEKGAAAASVKTEDNVQHSIKDAEAKYLEMKEIQHNLKAEKTHRASLEKNYSSDAAVSLSELNARYNKILDIWNRLGGELNSKFLEDWNNKADRNFTIFKAQSGYKYNVELSSMCKKGVPLFEAIDTIVKKEVMKELDLKVLGKAEKEILYDILKQHNFEIPCAICYVEQARQREGAIIDAFLNGNVEDGKQKLGWNKVLDSIEAEMKANGVEYAFESVSRDIGTDKYTPANIEMDERTVEAFHKAVQKIANEEIRRYNKENGKSRSTLKAVTPEAVKECFKGTLPANLKIFKVLLTEPHSRFRIGSDLLYSSMTTLNLSALHNELYGLFNMQGGVSGYKTKQGTTVYWGEILGKKWKPADLRNAGGVRNQSNSDFQIYTLIDQAQMYIDFTAKGYYLQAYTKVLAELKLFGKSRGKINASLIPKVVVYKDANGNVDVERTMANAGLDENGNPIYDDFEGINHAEAFMLLEDPDYSKSIGGVCIGYSDNHIRKLLDDPRVQLIIGFHDKTNDPDKRYRGARYAKNYNGLNEAVNKDGKTVHIGFNPYVKRAEGKFTYNSETEAFEGTAKFNGKEYSANDIPRLAADMYLADCAKKEYTPAYNDFADHPNYYKLLADFSLYDSTGRYAPHQKVAYNMPDTVPYLDSNGAKRYMATEDYIKVELEKELAVRDAIAEALADTSSEGIIPQFKAAVKRAKSQKNTTDDDGVQHSIKVTDKETLNFLNKQVSRGEYDPVKNPNGGYIKVYRSFQVIDGKLYAPMNAVDRDEDGKNKRLGYNSQYGVWEMATESPEIAQQYMDKHPDAPHAKFDLDGVDNDTNGVAYNPYLHASNLVLNDQFAAAYRRNLITVECYVPVSEANGAYKAKYAKDATGWVEWKPGGVAGKLMKIKPQFTRKLFVSRYMLPVREMKSAEIAAIYKEYLDGTNIKVPWNVVTPDLRKELVKAGVPIDYKDVYRTTDKVTKEKFYTKFAEVFPDDVDEVTQHSLKASSKAAVEAFGTTQDFDHAGFVLSDGRMLNLSQYGQKGVQHKRIAQVYTDTKGSDAVNRFIQEGNIRIKANSNGIEIGTEVAPTTSQFNAVAKFISRSLNKSGEFYLDITDAKGNSVASATYYDSSTEDIIYDIKDYYEKGRIPKGDVQYSLKIDTDGMTDEAKEIIDKLANRALHSKYNKGKYAGYTADRMENEISYSSANDIPDYAKSYIAWVDPIDFIYATADSITLNRLEEETGELDLERLRGESQPIHLIVDMETGQIVGHEGRHRMLALKRAGVQKVAVVLDARNDDRHNTKPIDFMGLKGQRFSDYRRGVDFWLSDILPLSQRYADAARQLFSEVEGSVQYSLKNPSKSDADYLAAVKRGDMETAQKMVDEAAKAAGYEHQMFHETDAENIHVFDISRGTHGGTDYQTPYGIFTKSSNKNIGLGSRQMALYVKAQNTLRVEDRDDVLNKIPGFAKYYDQIAEIDRRYGALAKQYEDEEFDALTEWMDEHPEADMDVVFPLEYIAEGKPADIDSERYLEAHKKYEENMAAWTKEYDAVAVKAKDYITNYLRSNGYDSMYFKIDGGSRGRQTDSLIVLDPNQVKSADPVTYDDDDNVIPLSERFNAKNPDIRHSLKGTSDEMRDYAKLKKAYTALQEQFKLTKFAKIDEKALAAYTKKLLKDYSSNASDSKVQDELDTLYTYLMNGENGESPTWEVAYDIAYDIADHILNWSNEADAEIQQTFADLREYLKNYKIRVDDYVKSDFGRGKDGYEYFRRQNFGRLKLGNDGVPVDVVYQELAGIFPYYFDEREVSNPADQLRHIVEVYEDLSVSEYRNPYKAGEFGRYEEFVGFVAHDIMERFYELPQAKPTFADKAERRLTEHVIKYANKIRALREEKHEAVAKVKKHYQSKEAKMSENRKKAALKDRIFRHTNDLSQKLLKGTKTQHLPTELRGTVLELLKSINLESNYEWVVGEDGKRHRVERGSDPNAAPTNRTKLFANLQEQYKQIAKDGTLVVDPALLGDAEVQGNFAKVIAMGDTRVDNMTLEELNTLWSVIRAVEKSITTANKVLAKAKYEATSEWAGAIRTETAGFRPATGAELSLDMQNPYTFFSHYGEAGKAVFRMLRDAQDAQMEMTDEIQKKVEKIVDAKTVDALKKKVHTFTTEGGDELTLSSAYIMNLLLLSKRQQAQGHLFFGGIMQPEIESAKVKRGDKFIPLTIADVKNITGTLTDEQLKIATALQKLTDDLAEYGNKAHETAFGYRKFTGENYWPIKSAKESLHSSADKSGQNVRSIKNIGLAKDLVPNATNALDCLDIFDTFASHAADMIDYAAWLCPMEDANRLLNFKFKDDAGLESDNMKLLINRIGGKNAVDYWEALMVDIQNGIKQQSDTAWYGKAVDKLVGNAKAAAVGANIRVIIQQPTAMIRAAAVLDPKDMAKGIAVGGGWKTAIKHSAIAKRKAQGGFDISSPLQMGEILFDGRTKLRKFSDAMMWGAGKADELAWGRIWNACEHQVKRTQENLKPGTKEFYAAVDKVFTEVIDQTQVVDGVLQRSQVMRSGSSVITQMTSFMGEPIMTLNMAMRAQDQLRNAKGKEKKKAARAFATRTVVTLLATNAVNALAQSLIDAIRDDDGDEKYWERVWRAFIGIEGDEETAWEKAMGIFLNGNLGSSLNPLAYIPLVKDGVSLVSGYDVSRMDADILGDVISAGQTFVESVSGKGKRTVGFALKELAHNVSRACGISATNVLRDVWGVVRSIAVETGNVELQYEMEKAIYKISNQSNTSRFTDILYRAYETDKKAYEKMYDDMVKRGVDPDKIKSGMESRMKKAQGVKKATDLEQRFLSPADQKKYDSAMRGVTTSSAWRKATAKQKDDAEDLMWEIITEAESSKKVRETIADGASVGLTDSDYVLYQLALDMVDQPTEKGKLGTFNNSERSDALLSTDLSDDEMAYLWDKASSAKENTVYDAMAAGVDAENYIYFMGALADLEYNKNVKNGRKTAVRRLLNSMNLTARERNWLYATQYKE